MVLFNNQQEAALPDWIKVLLVLVGSGLTVCLLPFTLIWLNELGDRIARSMYPDQGSS
jgi:hypothetical protein